MVLEPQLSRIAKYGPLTPEEVAAFEAMAGPAKRYARGQVIRYRGDPRPDVYVLLCGWLACSVTFDDGRRQIVKIHLPGDLVGVPSFAASVASETVHALSDAVVAPIALTEFGHLFRNHPRLAAILFLACQEERVILMQRLAWASRTRAIRRVAELILSLHDRVRVSQPDLRAAMFAPLSQEEIGDATGLTVVTVNQSLRELRRLRIASWNRFELEILDRGRLEELVGRYRETTRDMNWFDEPRLPDPGVPAQTGPAREAGSPSG